MWRQMGKFGRYNVKWAISHQVALLTRWWSKVIYGWLNECWQFRDFMHYHPLLALSRRSGPWQILAEVQTIVLTPFKVNKRLRNKDNDLFSSVCENNDTTLSSKVFCCFAPGEEVLSWKWHGKHLSASKPTFNAVRRMLAQQSCVRHGVPPINSALAVEKLPLSWRNTTRYRAHVCEEQECWDAFLNKHGVLKYGRHEYPSPIVRNSRACLALSRA